MLNIINNLEPFFRDNYRRINVREYARLTGVSPPSASKFLSEMEKEGLLEREKERNYIFYVAKRESRLFVELSRIYWSRMLERSGLVDYLEKECLEPLVVLFGSLSKAEAKKDSDFDVAVFTSTENKLDFSRFEKKLKRKVQVFVFMNRKKVKNRDLLNNILNGYVVRGRW